jgi:hypothetical protein
MTLRRAPLPSYAPRSAAGEIYAALWNEIDARLNRTPKAGRASAAAARSAPS